jgi:hypothetical protein
MADVRIERGTCRFVAKRNGGRATITLQFSQEAVSLLTHVTLSFNLLRGVTLEQAQKIAETLTDNVLDASVEMSSEHLMFVGVDDDESTLDRAQQVPADRKCTDAHQSWVRRRLCDGRPGRSRCRRRTFSTLFCSI